MLQLGCGGGSSASDAAPAAPLTSADCLAKRNVSGQDVFLLVGQSNMAGFGAYYVAGFDKTDPRIRQLTLAGPITLATEPLDHPSNLSSAGRIGPGLSFARSYLSDLPASRGVLLVPGAQDASGFSNGRWNPGDALYESAVRRTRAALANDPAGNCLGGVLWSQGEIDVINRMDAEAYRSALQRMVQDLRSRLPLSGDGSSMPFVLGQFSQDWVTASPTAAQKAILDVINATPGRLPYTAVASTAGLTSNLTQGLDGAIHIDAASQRIYGQRFREALKVAAGNANPR